MPLLTGHPKLRSHTSGPANICPNETRAPTDGGIRRKAQGDVRNFVCPSGVPHSRAYELLSPWPAALLGHERNARRGGMQVQDDVGQTRVRSVTTAEPARPLRDEMLALLIESAAAIHGAPNEQQLADVVMDAAIRGTGLANAVMLRPLDTSGHIEIIATRGAAASQSGQQIFSRSLIAAASNGQVAEISGQASQNVSHSIVQMKISAAICVPLMLGAAPAAFLYLDSRG